MEGQRLDKWLWCARLVKTRSLAAKLIEGGKVRVNGARAKVSRHVRLGDVVTGTGVSAGRLFVVRVMREAERRGPATIARSLWDLTPEAPRSASGDVLIEVHHGKRPTKRDRRRLEAVKSGNA
jgi:ribosome-associated heat shock protein Hsp15